MIKVINLTKLEYFELNEEEKVLVQQMRNTADKKVLAPLMKSLGFKMERRLTPFLLEKFGFTNIEPIGKSDQNTGPDPFDYYALKNDRPFLVNTKSMIKRSGKFSISRANFEAIERIEKEWPEILKELEETNELKGLTNYFNATFALLLLKVAEDGSKGTALLFLSA